MKNDADIGGFLSETFAIARDNLVPIAIFVAVMAFFGTGSDWLTLQPEILTESDPIIIVLAGFAVGIGAIVISVLAQYFLTSSMLGSRGELQQPGTRIWAYVGLSVLFLLGLMVGFLLLIVPGIILLTRWIAAPGYLIGGGRGVVESFGASWEATSEKGWHIFGGILILGLVGSVLIFGAAGAVLFAADSFSFATSLISNVLSNAFSAIFVAYGVAVYHLTADNTQHTTEVFE
ncbi:hypothetical protein GRI43_05585 [Altererythrobacter luteolus]|uniref:Glycerophosphoryl diester phosphodiesterase membrane domain-containing protein n=1 Tax=Pontixanthobacter luteolus TaxID=295089 RepID=A0A6I4V0S2_9SPHN|nr:hypothetical protein [Pontixanthobacter luteolus]MXP46861.1 hypothetical protein [Pontixanthobacter luteolus]